MNAERQDIEAAVRDAATRQIAGDERVLILAGEGWHRGVLGLAAGRIAQQWHRPTLVIAIDGDRCVGSGRSIRSVNLHEQLEAVSELFTHFGGHEFACGFSFPADRLPALRERLRDQFQKLPEEAFSRRAVLDGWVTLSDLDRDFVAAHELLQPFGAANDQPLFGIRSARVKSKRNFAEDCCELALEDATGTGAAVVWPSVKQLTAAVDGSPLDLLVRVEPDGWSPTGGRLVLADLRAAE